MIVLRGVLAILLSLMAPAIATAQLPPRVQSAKLFRPEDDRPRHDDAKAEKLHIQHYESRRLRLYTDIEPEVARTLPSLVDDAFEAWTAYFGPLPEASNGEEFQITGYLMRDPALFREAGMLGGDLPSFHHGRHRRSEFWMNDQDIPYYREHLLLHEATHCFMTIFPDRRLPLWYLEGMADFFGVHQKIRDGKTRFGGMPVSNEDVPGFGRIGVIRRQIREGMFHTPAGVLRLGPREFASQQSEPYAWSWALCVFLDANPHYRERFHQLAGTIHTDDFDAGFERAFESDSRYLAAEWENFTSRMIPAFDFEREAIEFRDGQAMSPNASQTLSLDAAHGWQSSGMRVAPGEAYEVTVSGRVTLATKTKPWGSEPEGISIDYAAGRPIGRVLGLILKDEASVAEGEPVWTEVLDIGSRGTIEPSAPGTLYLRVNDLSNGLDDNSGMFHVEFKRTK